MGLRDCPPAADTNQRDLTPAVNSGCSAVCIGWDYDIVRDFEGGVASCRGTSDFFPQLEPGRDALMLVEEFAYSARPKL